MKREDSPSQPALPVHSSQAPIFFLMVYLVFTFMPLIYNYAPELGQMKIVLVSGILLIVTYLSGRSGYTNARAFKNRITLFWACFLSVMALGLLVSVDRGSTLTVILSTAKYFLVYLIMIRIVDTPARQNLVLGVLVACAVGMGIGSIHTYFFEPESRLGGYRAIALDRGVFGDPNDLALLLNTLLPFALYFFITKRKPLLAAACALAVVAAIMLTFSRGGFVGLCMTAAGFFIFFRESRMKFALPALLAMVLFWSFAPGHYKERIASINVLQQNAQAEKTRTRLDAWKVVLENGAGNWVLGAGANSSFYIAGRTMSDWHSIHNSFIQVFVETGIFGFLSYLGVVLQPFRQYRLAAAVGAARGPDTTRFRIILISMLSYAVSASFLPQAYSPLLYLLTGLAVCESELIRKATPAGAA